MKNLEQLQNEACERFEKEILLPLDKKDWGICPSQVLAIQDFLKQEIKNAIQTAFKETSVEGKVDHINKSCEKIGFSCGCDHYDSALSDTKIKQNEFLNN